MFPFSNEPLLLELYSDFLIKNNEEMKAVYFLSLARPSDYFMFTAITRVKGRIKELLFNKTSSNLYEKEYVYALEYDRIRQSMAVQIHEILELKQSFWREVSCTDPLMVSLQSTGSQIVSKMYELNVFYSKVNHVY